MTDIALEKPIEDLLKERLQVSRADTDTMNAERLLIEKWGQLPATQQQAVLDLVQLLHDQFSEQKASGSPFTHPVIDQPATPQLQKSEPGQPVVIPEAERQRVLARLQAAWVNRPQLLERMKIRQQQGWEAAKKAASVLKTEFGAERVVLFGSLLDPEKMNPHSDIDLAVWGLSDEQLFKAWTAADYAIGQYEFPPIDLVPIEKAYPAIVEVVEREGVEL